MLAAEGVAQLGHGDLVRVVGTRRAIGDWPERPETRGFAVMTNARGVAEAPRVPARLGGARTSWDDSWEGSRATGYDLVTEAGDVQPARYAFVACDCVETVAEYLPKTEMKNTVDLVRRWAREGCPTTFSGVEDIYAASRNAQKIVMSLPSGSPAMWAARALRDTADVALFSAATFARDVAYCVARVSGMNATNANLDLAPLVRRWIPLSVALLARFGENLPIDLGARDNPRRRSVWRLA
jgi:hypothetical protein